MREIKFRIWKVKHKEMRQDYNYMIDAFGTVYWQFGYDAPKPLIKGEEVEIMQFTGLKDKNGKDIFESDICEGPNGANKIKVKVIWDGFGVPGLMSLDSCNFMDMAQVGAEVGFKNIEVIGNIYENPELLDKK